MLADKWRVTATAAHRSRWPLLAVLAGSALAAVVELAAFWPGVMTWDAIRQYGQALSGRYDDWHPPAMNWLWRQLGVFGAGPAPMLVAQAGLYWGGIALLAAAAGWSGRRRWLPVAVVACALLPVPLVLVGTVLKDSLMAGALLVAAGLLAIRRPGDRALALAAALILLGAATLRFNAAPACLPLLFVAAPPAWRRARRRQAVVLIVGTLVLAAALPTANRLLRAERTGVELSLAIYDLGGIARFSGIDVFPPVGVADPVAVNARCYSPEEWDSYAWWTDAPCPIGFARVRAAFAARGESPTRWWLAAIARHPIAYLEHRAAHADHNLRLWVSGDDDVPELELESDPNPWRYRVARRPARSAIDAMAMASLATPLGWPACWLALALAVLVVRPVGAGPGAPIAWSAALYGLSYVPLSVASEVRYHFWTMTGAALAATFTLAALRDEPAVARWRWWCAAALVAATVAVSVAARVVG